MGTTSRIFTDMDIRKQEEPVIIKETIPITELGKGVISGSNIQQDLLQEYKTIEYVSIMLRDAITCKYWLAQRIKEGVPSYLKYCCPGGKIEIGETKEQACIRELKEETGIEMRDTSSLRYIQTNQYTKNKDGYQNTMRIVHLYEIFDNNYSFEEPQRTEPEKHGPWKPYSIKEIAELIVQRKVIDSVREYYFNDYLTEGERENIKKFEKGEKVFISLEEIIEDLKEELFEESEGKTAKIVKLPKEIFDFILDKLNMAEIVKLMQTCKNLYNGIVSYHKNSEIIIQGFQSWTYKWELDKIVPYSNDGRERYTRYDYALNSLYYQWEYMGTVRELKETPKRIADIIMSDIWNLWDYDYQDKQWSKKVYIKYKFKGIKRGIKLNDKEKITLYKSGAKFEESTATFGFTTKKIYSLF
jgi:8-oxo-dGTP pyrophosphatase MutT (NUDIX family)